MAELESFGYTQELRRSLGFRDLVIYVALRLAGRTPAMAGMSGADARDDAAAG